ncbi:MAG TPA: CDP-glucose 4,6-dehydratase [Candidatus Paceibacterota bacterium]|nr:CDP-glucose 4,6-dehydratase [Candidatus Paceibacterota bacterium]HMO82756.1 CDP-glucose 4,6-dehydratase [Candidatus Paceibacterota bacterium]
MNHFYSGKKVLITGHTGFKGAWLTQVLLGWGAEVVGVSLAPSTTPNLFTLLGHQHQITNYYCDIRDTADVLKIIDSNKPEILFHLAAQPLVRRSYEDPLLTISTNATGTASVLDAIKQAGTVKSVVVITTDKVYKDQDWVYPYREIDMLGGYDPYSASKAAADIITQSYIQSFFNPKDYGVTHNTLVAIARAGNVIGGGDWAKDRLIPDIMRAVYEKNIPVLLRYPKAIRPWEHVLESLSGYLMLAQRIYLGQKNLVGAWNFGPLSESFVSVESVTKTILSNLRRGSVIIDPNPNAHETNLLRLDISKVSTQLGWSPTLNYKETIDYTASWYKEYYENRDVSVITKEQINTFFKNI